MSGAGEKFKIYFETLFQIAFNCVSWAVLQTKLECVGEKKEGGKEEWRFFIPSEWFKYELRT